jgi:hypothetical protein
LLNKKDYEESKTNREKLWKNTFFFLQSLPTKRVKGWTKLNSQEEIAPFMLINNFQFLQGVCFQTEQKSPEASLSVL